MNEPKKHNRTTDMFSAYVVLAVIWIALCFPFVWSIISWEFGSVLILLPFVAWTLWLWFYWINNKISEKNKMNKLKKVWILKMVEITKIEKTGTRIKSWSEEYYWYRIIANDWKKEYKTNTMYFMDVSEEANIWDKMPIYVSSENPDYYWCDIDNIEKSNNPINNDDNLIQRQLDRMHLWDKEDMEFILNHLDSETSFKEDPKIPKVVYLFFLAPIIIWLIIFFAFWVYDEVKVLFEVWYSDYYQNINNHNPDLIVAILVSIIFIYIWLSGIYKLRKQEKLIKNWIKTMARITEIKRVYWKNSWYVLYASNWANNFESDKITFNDYKVWDEISVFVDENNPKNYWVDTSWAALSKDKLKNYIERKLWWKVWESNN